jgi:hypothetical protein
MLEEIEQAVKEYAPDEQVPLAGYTTAMLTYSVGLAGVLALTRKKRWTFSWSDLALLGVATHKLSRIITKDFVTAPLRAPFTRRQAAEGAGEVHDEPRGSGLRSSVGYLLTCPYCTGPWIATALSAFLVLRPVPTRFVLRALGAVTVSDFLHLSYSRLNESRKVVVAERRRAEIPPEPRARPRPALG